VARPSVAPDLNHLSARRGHLAAPGGITFVRTAHSQFLLENRSIAPKYASGR